MQVDSALLDMPFTIDNANSVKEVVLTKLRQDKVINNEQYNLYNDEWQIMIYKTSWFKRWYNRFLKKDKDVYVYDIIKPIYNE